MSLKAFHILFITVSIAMSVVVGGWGIDRYRETGETLPLAVGLTCLLMGVVLVWYSIWFVKKIRTVLSA